MRINVAAIPLSSYLLIIILQFSVPAFAQNNLAEIAGRVKNEKGEGLSAVSVVAKNAISNFTAGVQTDSLGIFRFTNLPSGSQYSFTFSYVGFEPQTLSGYTLKPNAAVSLVVKLKELNNSLNDVVVVGYGTQRKATLTGAVSTVSAKDLRDLPVSNLSNALSGRVPGLTVITPTGRPGSSSSINIRGLGTFNNTSPLYVIDGVVRDQFAIDGLDPNEIDNITVLKDAASAAVYGSRASNGVILVTTKRGSSQKPEINYKVSVGTTDQTKKVKIMDAYDMASYNNDAVFNMNGMSQAAAEAFPGYFTADELAYFRDHTYDWLDEASHPTNTQQHNLSVNGGSENIKYFLSTGLFKEGGFFNNLDYSRYNLRANVDAKISSDLTVSLNLDGNIKKNQRPYWLYDIDQDALQDLYRGFQHVPPFFPSYIEGKPVGNGGSGNFVPFNPGEIVNNGGYLKNNWKALNGLIALEYKVPFVTGLKLKGSYSYNASDRVTKGFYKPVTLYQFATTGDHNHILTDEITGTRINSQHPFDFVSKAFTETNSSQFDIYATYNKTVGEHHIGATFVYEQFEAMYSQFGGRRENLLTPLIDELYIGGSDPNTLAGKDSVTGRLSYVGRINYDYAGKYILETAFRYDGSQIFPPGRRWGFFPSVSAAWRISEEKFMDGISRVVSNLKLRSSFGLVGNDAVLPFQYQQNFTVANGPYFGGATNRISSELYPNRNITWEKTRTVNVGLDAGFLSNALTVQFDYFKRHTYDLLLRRNQTIPGTFGISLPSENYGIVDVKGWELAIGYNGKAGNGISYYVNGNIGSARSKVIKIDVAPGTPDYLNPIGFPLNRLTGYISDGIVRTDADKNNKLTLQGWMPELGILSFKDIYGPGGGAPDGIVNGNDIVVISQKADPRYNFGMSLGGSWKRFALDLFFQGFAGWEKLITNDGNYDFWKDHFSNSNTDAAYPRAYYGDAPTYNNSTFWLKNASFLRLKSANISYTLPSAAFKGSIRSLRLFVTGNNLSLIFNKLKVMDPESPNLGYYPIMRNITGGANITF